MSMSKNNHQESNRDIKQRLRPGDVTSFKREAFNHFAVYIGDGKVIHKGVGTDGQKKSNASIVEAKLDDVIDGCEMTRKDVSGSHFSREEIVERAKSQLGKSTYHFLGANCEHFANWAAFDENKSDQVQDGVKYVVKVGKAVSAALFSD